MKSPTFLFFLLLFSQIIYSQKAAVRGRVYDQQNKIPVEYASVALLTAKDSVVTAGTVTKANGSFELMRVPAGTFRLKVSFVGYYTTRTEVFTVDENSGINLGTVTLLRAGDLMNEVKVTAGKSPMTSRIDKQIYLADQFENARGGTAIDVLKNLPSVSLNGEGEISVRGSSGFLVLLNGKPVLTDAQTVLAQLPANSVQSIELITSPSAKYDPDGKGGIINIITKKGTNDGITFTSSIQGGLPSTTDHGNKKKPQRFGGDMAFNYRRGKWDISVAGNYLRADVSGFREGDVYTRNLANNTITRFPSTGERSFDRYNYAGRMSVSFQADSSNSFAASLMTGHRFQSRLADLVYNNSKADISSGAILYTNTYYNSNVQSKHGVFSLGSLEYSHVFRNKSTLTTSALFEHANLYGDTKNRNLGYPQTKDTLQYVYNPYRNPINGYRLKVDYAKKTRTGKWESGYQFRYDTQDGRFDYFVSPVTSQSDAARFRGSASAKNIIHGIYTQYSGRFEQLEYNAGLRYESASRSVKVSYETSPYRLNLSNLFPSATLLYPFHQNWQAKAGYSKRIQRTTNFELNPIPEREHSETLEQGDPNLLPEFIDLAELGVVHQFKGGSFFFQCLLSVYQKSYPKSK